MIRRVKIINVKCCYKVTMVFRDHACKADNPVWYLKFIVLMG